MARYNNVAFTVGGKEDALDPADQGQAGELYVYRAAMQPRAVLERLERLVIVPRSR